MAATGTDIKRAKMLLEKGDLVAIPTETVYGLAGNAFNASAVAKIFATKNRPTFDPLIVHTHHMDQVKDFTRDMKGKAAVLAQRFWPGPLTLLLKRKDNIPDLVTSGLDTVAVRIPNHPLTLQLLEQLSFPLAAPSANPFGYISPTAPEHVEAQLGAQLEYILDGGASRVGIESTIVGFDQDEAIIHRLGGTSIEKIESVIGKVKIKPHSSSNPKAPGMLANHYAPKKPLLLGDIAVLAAQHQGRSLAILSFDKTYDHVAGAQSFVLSPTGSLEEAASTLFSKLRMLDQLSVELILASEVPDHGIGKAINDRLKRAAAK